MSKDHFGFHDFWLWDAPFPSHGGFVKPDAKKRAIPRLSGRECHFRRPISLKRSVGQASRYRESRKLCPKMTFAFMTFGSGTHRFRATEDLSGPTLKMGRFFRFRRKIYEAPISFTPMSRFNQKLRQHLDYADGESFQI